MDVKSRRPSDAAHLSLLSTNQQSRHPNTPEEDDETMSAVQQDAGTKHKLDPTPEAFDGRLRLRDDATPSDFSLFGRQRLDRGPEPKHVHLAPQTSSSFYSSHAPQSLPAGYGQPTPFPSQANGSRGWFPPSIASSGSGYPNSLPSRLSQEDDDSCRWESCPSRNKFLSLDGGHSAWTSSLEQPLSLRSNPPSAEPRHHTLSPYACSPQGAVCCAQCPPDAFPRVPAADELPWPQRRPAHSPYYPGDCRPLRGGFTQIGHSVPAKEKQPAYSMSLSLEQRKVFVTYEADNDKHINEIINFVALLRHNGFDTHIDLFEQQFRSISTIDFMERYLSEKEYLIIIIISPKYYETVTASPVSLENDERTFNTVYIHKQLQNEFIQNGSKNFRFIPILFPGARKCHVPNWLQNTHVYGWPRDRDDILRRLMRVEKYNPPPVGELPTIVSIPI
ncbi:adapter protein CIKS isoform X2 [Salarias fasciatus]|uniref:adapter protein CIKS isoform X2 n=1 Tax=Salarias fasciatus TaxID=181472 RepID=UPI00117660C0|nr:adapter protein CIKS-like isoform X2 [Salarias fasciatus]